MFGTWTGKSQIVGAGTAVAPHVSLVLSLSLSGLPMRTFIQQFLGVQTCHMASDDFQREYPKTNQEKLHGLF